jgi:hypothetical protein
MVNYSRKLSYSDPSQQHKYQLWKYERNLVHAFRLDLHLFPDNSLRIRTALPDIHCFMLPYLQLVAKVVLVRSSRFWESQKLQRSLSYWLPRKVLDNLLISINDLCEWRNYRYAKHRRLILYLWHSCFIRSVHNSSDVYQLQLLGDEKL